MMHENAIMDLITRYTEVTALISDDNLVSD